VELPLDLVRTFAQVVASGSLDAAAGALNVTPSAVSQRLKALESRLGRVLLVRSKPVAVTDAGRVVLRLARQLAALEADGLAELGLDDRAAGVPLAVNADSLGTWFLGALAPLAAEGMTFELFRDDQEYTAGLLESGTVSAAVTSQQRPVAGCSSRPLGAIRYLPVASPAFVARWLGDAHDAVAFEAAPLIDYDRRDALQSRFLTELGADPVRPPRHYVPASADFATATMLGFGWALVPEQQALPALADGRLVRLAGDPLDVPLHWQRWKLDSPVLARIEDAVVGAARSVLRPAA
jgi:LysR family transcriptional regulator (chromosome initiation inhibitor)